MVKSATMVSTSSAGSEEGTRGSPLERRPRNNSWSEPLVIPPSGSTVNRAQLSRVTSTWAPGFSDKIRPYGTEAHPEPSERSDFPQDIRKLAERSWIYRFLGFHTCTHAEKVEIGVLLIFVMFIVAAALSASLIEAKAFDKTLPPQFYGQTLQNTASAAVAYLTFFRAIFAFLGTTLLAMLGSVPNETRDEAGEEKRSVILGKIVQIGTVVALGGGAICWSTIISTYKTFLRSIYHLEGPADNYAVELIAVYVQWACASLPLAFCNSVFRSFYMQTGRFLLVAIDLLMDVVLFNLLINLYAIKKPVEHVSEACGITTFMVTLFKFVVYVGWSCRVSEIKRYKFFAWEAEGVADIYQKLGTDVTWQGISTMAMALWTFLLSIVMYQFNVVLKGDSSNLEQYLQGSMELLANGTAVLSIVLLSVPGLIASFLVMWKGTTYLADSRYRSFAGMVRNVMVSQAICAICWGTPAGNTLQDFALKTVAGSLEELVKPVYEQIKPWVTATGIIASNWQCMQAILYASSKYWQVAVSNIFVFMVVGIGASHIGQSHDSFKTAFWCGQTLPYSLGTVWFFIYYWYMVRPEHLLKREDWLKATIHDDSPYMDMEGIDTPPGVETEHDQLAGQTAELHQLGGQGAELEQSYRPPIQNSARGTD